MDTPVRAKNNVEIKEMIHSLQQMCHSQKQKRTVPLEVENQRLRAENEALLKRVRELEEKVEELSKKEPEMSEEEQSLHFALMLQQQEQMDFQNRLQMMAQADTEDMSYEQLNDLSEKIGFVSRGYSSEQIDMILNHCQLDRPSEECCTICLEEGEEDVSVELKCHHAFHGQCIKEWLSHEKQCPVCKREVQLQSST